MEIELLERKNGRHPFHAVLNGHISTEDQQQINEFADKGLDYRPQPPPAYESLSYDDMVGARMLKRAHELCDVDPDMRLNVIAGEFPYVSLLKAHLQKKADEPGREARGL